MSSNSNTLALTAFMGALAEAAAEDFELDSHPSTFIALGLLSIAAAIGVLACCKTRCAAQVKNGLFGGNNANATVETGQNNPNERTPLAPLN